LPVRWVQAAGEASGGVWGNRATAGRHETDFGMSESKGKVLIVEDQFLASEYLKIWTETFGFEVCGVATTADAAIELAKQHKPTHVLMDVRLEGKKDGIDAAMEIQKAINTRIIYCTGSSEPSTVKRINTDHPFEILFKPIDSRLLGEALLKP
jgi:DNA-binding NarL/FixJ family response regulator